MPHEKILFRLDRDEDGYPPFDVEGVWAEPQEDAFVLDNIPFFTREATLGDVVEVHRVGDELFYAATREPSANSLIRVVMFGEHDPQDLRDRLRQMGCASELSHLPSLFAVNVPPEVPLAKVRELLDDACAQNLCDYEEPILRHP